MGLYDRDYMRQRQGKDDAYWNWLHRSHSRGTAPEREGQRSYWKQPVTAKQAMMMIALILALVLLPHFTIASRHWHVWFLPL